MFSEDTQGAFASAAIQGNIGAQIMCKFKILLDYDHNRIILEPNASFKEPMDHASSGLKIIGEGKTTGLSASEKCLRILLDRGRASKGRRHNSNQRATGD